MQPCLLTFSIHLFEFENSQQFGWRIKSGSGEATIEDARSWILRHYFQVEMTGKLTVNNIICEEQRGEKRANLYACMPVPSSAIPRSLQYFTN
jgi:hypothetical protein